MFIMKNFSLLLTLITVIESRSPIVGLRGHNVTLPCSYDFQHHGALSVCWGRGVLPNSGCSRLILSTDGHKVIEHTRVSSRYQLLGRLDRGDVSLTVLDLTDDDAGQYGCRVEVNGWFNDEKHDISLVIERGSELTTSTPPDHEMTTGQTTVNTTADHLTSTLNLMTSSSESVQAEDSGSVSVVLVCVAFVIVALLMAGAVLITVRRWNILKKISEQQQQASPSVQFSSTVSTLQLHRRSSAVENIYQIDEGEYESCP